MLDRRWGASLLMLTGALLLFWRVQTTPARPDVAAPAVIAAPRTSAPTRPPPAPEADDGAETPLPRVFSDGFCAEPGAPEPLEIRHTLAMLIHEESERRLASLGDDAREELLRAARDFLMMGRVPDTVSAADALLLSAREDGAPKRMLELAEQVIARVPSDPYLEVVRALAASRLNRPEVEVEALRKARLRLPQSPAVGLALALDLLDTPDLDEAVAALDSYLAVEHDPVASRLRARLIVAADIQRDYARRTRDGVTLLWPPTGLDEARVEFILRSIAETLDSSSRRFGAPRRPTLLAVAYPSRSELLAVTCAPNWAAGAYNGTLRLVVPPEVAVDRLLSDLRHEATHAVLRPFAPLAPQWFHEGSAQLLASEPLPRESWEVMVRNQTWIPFESLDGTFLVFDKTRDAGLAYAEGRALVEWIQARGGDAALARAAREFQSGAKTMEVLAHATGQQTVTGNELLAFLAQRLGEAR